MNNTRVQIYCDFDGTITTRDTIVYLTEKHGAGAGYRKEMLEAIKSGRLSVFDVIRQELQTVKLSWEEAQRSLSRNIEIDPTFPGFVNWCRRNSLSLHVVSSGLEPTVRLFVGDFGLSIHAHPVEFDPQGWRYQVRDASRKSVVLDLARKKGRVVYVGDGTSDVDAIPFADVLFAKSFLEGYCLRQQIAYEPFESFVDVRERLEEYLVEWGLTD